MTEQTENNTIADEKSNKTPRDPVRMWTFIILGICLLLVTWYLRADRITPFTSQARVNAMVVPVAPQVAGVITSVDVRNNQEVKEGQILFQIDTRNYGLAVQAAEAQYAGAQQALAAAAAAIDAAKAQVKSAQANFVRARQDTERMRSIRSQDEGAISLRRLQMSEASLSSAEAAVTAAEANLRQAVETYGSEGDRNSRILQAQANLDQARYNLERTTVRAPLDGLVTNMRLDKGNYAAAGAPQMTFVATHNHWLQADFTENNLGHIRPGMTVEMVYDVYPGQVFQGTIREMGYGVAVDTSSLGALPTIQNNRSWLRDAQRFPVLIDIGIPREDAKDVLKVGSQVSVIVYTGDHWLWNALARLYIRSMALLSYAY